MKYYTNCGAEIPIKLQVLTRIQQGVCVLGWFYMISREWCMLAVNLQTLSDSSSV